MAVDQTTLMLLHEAQVTNALQIVSSATPAVNSDYTAYVDISALVVPVTSFSSGLTGSPVDGQTLVYRILAAGAQGLTWGAAFENVGATAPVITVAGKRHTVTHRFSTASGKWGCTAVAVEA